MNFSLEYKNSTLAHGYIVESEVKVTVIFGVVVRFDAQQLKARSSS
jgi:hypothetical protein